MPKSIRPHAPGQFFHLTARTQNKTHWFDEDVRDEIQALIRESAIVTQTPVVAFTVMANHLHIVVQQAKAPLGWLMHRVLHRTALIVKQRYQPDGHVFGRRYWSGLCDDARYTRQAIIYTHLNAVYAGMCAYPTEYRWTSHYDYINGGASAGSSVAIERGLPLFSQYESSRAHSIESYSAILEYWRARPRLPLGVKYIWTDDQEHSHPLTVAGDLYWRESQKDLPALSCAVPSRPVYDAAVQILRKLDPTITLDVLRMFGRAPALWRIRRELIAALLSRGYRGSSIAKCLNVSAALVSIVKREIEAAALHG